MLFVLAPIKPRHPSSVANSSIDFGILNPIQKARESRRLYSRVLQSRAHTHAHLHARRLHYLIRSPLYLKRIRRPETVPNPLI